MKFKGKIGELQKVLQTTLQAVPKKSTIETLENFYVSLKNDTLEIIGSDQEITFIGKLQVEGIEDGAVLVPAKKLFDIVRSFPQDTEYNYSVNYENYESQLKTSFGNYNLKGIDPDEYLSIPELFQTPKPEFSEVTDSEINPDDQDVAFLDKDDFTRLCDKTHYAIAAEEYRPAMSGLFMQFRGDRMYAVATDSYRLVRAVGYAKEHQFPAALDVLLPSRAVEILRKIDDNATLSTIRFNQKITHARFDYGNYKFITRVIEEKFPPYETVIPNNNNIKAIVKQKLLLTTLRRVAICANNISKQVVLTFKEDTVTITARDEDSGMNAAETFPCNYIEEPLTIAFNHRFLDDAISNTDSSGDDTEIQFLFSESNRPSLIKPVVNSEDLYCLLMPVRV